MTDIQSDLRDGWVWTTIGEITTTVATVDPTQYPDMPLVYVDISSIDNSQQRIVSPKQYLGKEAPSRPRQKIQLGDVLLSTVRPYLRNIAYVTDEFDAAIASTGFAVLRAEAGVNGRYIFYFTLTDEFITRLSDFQRGVSYPAVRDIDVRSQVFPLAPLNEQHRIVEAIESYFTRLDAAEAALRRAQAKLAQYKTALLKAACEGRLVPTEAELARQEGRAYEPAEVLLARVLKERRAKWEAEEWARLVARARQRAAAEAGKAEWLDLSEIVYAKYLPKDDKWKEKYQEPVAPDLDGLPELPEGWCWSSLGRTYPISVGSTPSRAHPEYWDGDVPWVSSGEVAFCRIRSTRERISELGLKNSSTVVHPIGTVMLGMIGEGRTRGQAAILDIAACHNQNSAAIRVSEVGMPPEYVYYYLYSRYEETRRGSSGNNQLALNRSRVQSIPFSLPPLAEQERIVAEVERRLSLVDALETALATNLTRAARLRQAILRRAFAGQLVPQDANDEPAAVLLARIRDCRGAPLRSPVSRRGS